MLRIDCPHDLRRDYGTDRLAKDGLRNAATSRSCGAALAVVPDTSAIFAHPELKPKVVPLARYDFLFFLTVPDEFGIVLGTPRTRLAF
jgi:hypothetical protein